MAQGFALLRASDAGEAGLRLEVASPSLQDITGHTLAWFVEEPARLAGLVVPADRTALTEAIAHSRRRGDPIRLRLRLGRADGTQTTVLLHAHRNDEGGTPAWDGILIDMSAEGAAEDERRRLSEELTQARRHESLGLLAGGIAHDFNNLLGAIRGQVELLRPSLADETAQRRCARTLDGVDRAAGLVRQLLAYTGRGRIELRELDVGRELTSLQDLLGPSLPKGVELRLDLAQDLPRVSFDPSQFHQVVMNLVINAAEAYEGRPGTVEISARPHGPHLMLEIRDHGCGMDDETQARMFDPYFTTKPKGHGLGLAAVHGIIRERGGAIQCRSRPGSGTVFLVSLLVSEARPVSARVEKRSPSGSQDLPILVADDEDLMREATADLLRSLGHRVLLAADGTSAGTLLDQPLLAAVLDDRMPGSSGLALLHRLRGNGSPLPVVLISGMLTSADLSAELVDARTRFLAKPFDRDQLARALAGAMSGDPDDGSSSSLSAVRQLARRRTDIATPLP
jgi:signal transduction histidine kinase/CheY-like chemotaxis protein